MKALYCPDSSVDYKTLVDAMAPILKTAASVLELVVPPGNIRISQSTGTMHVLVCNIYNTYYVKFLYYFVIRIQLQEL